MALLHRLLQRARRVSAEHTMLHVFCICFITVLSLSQLQKLYFSFEDYHLFYLFQNPDETKYFLSLPVYSRHLNYYYFIYPLFRLFGYTTTGYYGVVFLLACCAGLLFYVLVSLLVRQRRIAYIAGIIFASSYFGIESYTWNTVNGIELNTSFIFMLSILISLTQFIRKKKIKYFLFALCLYSVVFCFFKAKMFSFSVVIFLEFFLLSSFSLKEKIAFSFPFAFLSGVLLVSTVQRGINRVHTVPDLGQMAVHFFGTFGNLFFPSTVIEILYGYVKEFSFTKPFVRLVSLDMVLAIIGLWCVFMVFLLLTKLRKMKSSLFPLALFGLINIVFYILLVFFAAISESGLFITTLQSVHHNLSPVVFWSVLLIAITIVVLHKSKNNILKSLAVLLVIAYVGGGTALSASEIYRIDKSKRQLRYFYHSLLAFVPHVSEPTVFYFLYSSPRPYYPFSSGDPTIRASCYLAGFYHTTCRNIFIAKTFEEAMELLRQHAIPKERFYYFYYEKDHLVNLTDEVSRQLDHGGEQPITSDGTALHIPAGFPAYIPFYVDFDLSVRSAFERVPIDATKKELSAYYDLLIKKHFDAKTYTATTSPVESSDEFTIKENVFDGSYKTIWQPKQWASDGASVTIRLGKPQEIHTIAWSSSRVNPWKMRSPTQYEILLSRDNMNWQTVVHGNLSKPLGTNEYVVHAIRPMTAQYVKMHIIKTYLNFPPAIDEIEVFGDDIKNFDYATYYTVRSQPLAHIPSQETLHSLFDNIYRDDLSMDLFWKVDKSIIWTDDRRQSFAVNASGMSDRYSLYMPPSGFTMTAVKVSESNFPVTFFVSNVKVRFATWLDVLKK